MGIKATSQIVVLIILLLAAALLFSCSNSVNSDNQDLDDPPNGKLPAVTPGMIDSADFRDEEPALMALWYGDRLIPDRGLYEQFRDALKELRKTFKGSIPEVNIRFKFPSAVSQLMVILSDSAVAEYRAGNYTAWDSLNTLFRLQSIDTSLFSGSLSVARLTFSCILHPDHLALYYEELPGVDGATANLYGGDWSNLYPWILDGEVTFLARDAWGDCPSGCIENHFFYFKRIDSEFQLIGDWWFWTPVPEWWEEGRAAFCAYKSHGYCD